MKKEQSAKDSQEGKPSHDVLAWSEGCITEVDDLGEELGHT